MTGNQENKFSLSVLKVMLKNSVQLSSMIWKEKKGQVVVLTLVFLIVSAMPFIRSGSYGLLINELVRIAGSGQVSYYLFVLMGVLILVTLVPSVLLTVQSYLSKLFWFFLGEKFETLIIKKRGELDVAIHEDPKQNDLYGRINEEGSWRLQQFVDRQFFIFQNVIEVSIASVILIFVQWFFSFHRLLLLLLLSILQSKLLGAVYSLEL